ncbi:hypothetical protein HDV01_004585 [Terramyces sp. JEL0728]|nr:hypothetical protein HDV01_004585 [Terramyces sp. JEL0728]
MSDYKRQNIIIIETPADYSTQPVKDIYNIGDARSRKLATQGIKNIGQLENALKKRKVENQDFIQNVFNDYMAERAEAQKWKFIESIQQYVYVSEGDYKMKTLRYSPGIKTFLFNTFSGAKFFAKIQHIDAGFTKMVIQGHPNEMPNFLEYLKELLQIEYNVDLVWDIEKVVGENRLTSVTIEDTVPAELKRDPSSGEFLEKQFEEISFGGSAATENIKKITKEVLSQTINTGKGYLVAQGWIPEHKKEHITVKHRDDKFDLEVSTLLSLSDLIQAVQNKFNVPAPIKSIFRLRDGNPVIVTDVKDLRADFLYYVLTVNEELPKKKTTFSNMEEFYGKLKTEQGLNDIHIEIIKQVFNDQIIGFQQLNTLTDEELKECGLQQVGFRKAILKVIENNK